MNYFPKSLNCGWFVLSQYGEYWAEWPGQRSRTNAQICIYKISVHILVLSRMMSGRVMHLAYGPVLAAAVVAAACNVLPPHVPQPAFQEPRQRVQPACGPAPHNPLERCPAPHRLSRP
ncbi:hypothetical protein EVAR_78779_1 [Eumeta japonica]|uniref:Uncharacterized protein n=1 Tax=Eumeta variegata TaxID=151549 RepID=A0A4C1T1G0_EUMVA|nr:hypothetical protein EVAR_78779_1 [Eumeta japonica]